MGWRRAMYFAVGAIWLSLAGTDGMAEENRPLEHGAQLFARGSVVVVKHEIQTTATIPPRDIRRGPPEIRTAGLSYSIDDDPAARDQWTTIAQPEREDSAQALAAPKRIKTTAKAKTPTKEIKAAAKSSPKPASKKVVKKAKDLQVAANAAKKVSKKTKEPQTAANAAKAKPAKVATQKADPRSKKLASSSKKTKKPVAKPQKSPSIQLASADADSQSGRNLSIVPADVTSNGSVSGKPQRQRSRLKN